MRALLKHDDHRVRIEALRALVPLLRQDSVNVLLEGLRDHHERVRQAALTLLRSSEDESVEAGLLEALDTADIGIAEKKKLIEILGSRRSEAVRAALERIAGSKALRSAARELRDAARQALEDAT